MWEGAHYKTCNLFLLFLNASWECGLCHASLCMGCTRAGPSIPRAGVGWWLPFGLVPWARATQLKFAPGLRGAALSDYSVYLSCNFQTRRREANSSLLRSCLAKGKRKILLCPGRSRWGRRVTLHSVSAMGPSLQTRRHWGTI